MKKKLDWLHWFLIVSVFVVGGFFYMAIGYAGHLEMSVADLQDQVEAAHLQLGCIDTQTHTYLTAHKEPD